VKKIGMSGLGEWMRERKEGVGRMAERTERAMEEVRREFENREGG